MGSGADSRDRFDGIADSELPRYTSQSDHNPISVTPQLPAAIERPLARERLLLHLIPGLAALLVVTLFALAFLTLVKSRDASLRDAERTSRNLVQIVEQGTARMLQSRVTSTLPGDSQ